MWIRSFATLLLPIILSPSLAKGYLLADYILNKDYIAEFLCINKDVPKSNCDGKCYLSTLLKESERSDENQQLPETVIRLLDIALYFTAPSGIKFEFNGPDQNSQNFRLDELYADGPAERLFRPPRI